MKYHISFDLELRKNPYKGLFVAIEGIDGSGKSTQAERLQKELERQGRTVLLKHPFEGELGAFVRTILAGERKVPAIALQYLISANRSVQQDEIIEALKAGRDVIIDRYVWSAVAYGILDHPQMEQQEALPWLLIGQSVLSMYHQFLMPDTTLFLQISPETAKNRLDTMSKKKEIYEDSEKIGKIADIYQWLIREFSDEFTVINSDRPIDDVAKDMIKIVSGIK